MKYWSFGILAALLIAGCTTPWGEIDRNITNSKNLRVGMTKNQVLEVMGQPITDELFCKPDVWYYFIQSVWQDGLTTEDECMPLVFEEGKLVGWGNPFYAKYRLKPEEAVPQNEDISALPETNQGENLPSVYALPL